MREPASGPDARRLRRRRTHAARPTGSAASSTGRSSSTTPDDAAPIVYLPGYRQGQLRAVEEAPAEIQPIAELQYRGAVFSQVNGKDWTIPAFLQANTYGGLGIEVAADNATQAAIRAGTRAAGFGPGQRLRPPAPLKAAFFNDLLAPDLPRPILEWLDDPVAFQASLLRCRVVGLPRAVPPRLPPRSRR